MGFGQVLVNLDKYAHFQDRAVGLFVELVSTVTGSDCDRQGIHAGLVDKLDSL
jgi:hypothetical protein